MKAVLLTLVMLLAIGVVAVGADKANVTGKWQFEVETSGGSGTPSFDFQQDGEKLTGTYKGQLGTAKLEGTVKENKIEFKFTVDLGGNPGTVVYTGTIEEDGTMKGKVALAEFGEGTWKGKRVEDKK